MFMPSYNEEVTKFEREKTRIHDRMERAFDELCDACSSLQALEDHYDLHEPSIEEVDGWAGRFNAHMHQVGYLISELEEWAFDGDTLVLAALYEDDDE
jgi:hypothetical protein